MRANSERMLKKRHKDRKEDVLLILRVLHKQLQQSFDRFLLFTCLLQLTSLANDARENVTPRTLPPSSSRVKASVVIKS